MTPTKTVWQYLEHDPKSNYRQLSIKGRRIKARTVYGMYMCEEPKMTVEEVAEQYGIPVEAVKEAIAYCESDPPELLADYRFDEMIMEAAGMNEPGYKYHGKPKPIPPEERARIRRLCYPAEFT
jgi:uncharacterized protein (DUF433 family)